VALHVVEPWTDPRWDAFVASHPRATVYHTSAWIQIVCDIGRYPSLCLLHEHDGRVTGILPLAAIDSRLTGRRISSLPFSDMGFALAEDPATARALIDEARVLRDRRGAAFYEMRGAAVLRDGTELPADGFARAGHFFDYLLPLNPDTGAMLATFSKKSVRYMISKGEKQGVTVRRGGNDDLDAFYELYVRTRRRHGVPPQPRRLFLDILTSLRGSPGSALHLAEHEGRALAATLTLRYNGTTYLKYEVVDETRRHLSPVHPLLWQTIQEAALAGDRWYDFGRTAADNQGLSEFKRRWGTTAVELPYYFDPPGEGMSVVKSDSLKYRVFTRVFKAMPPAWSVRLGERIFRHFG
jgi:CelD/BcsL family acetyltransferase involved in cellulose biosynthesis